MRKLKGPLEERKPETQKLVQMMQLDSHLLAVAERCGKDALMSVILDVLGLAERGMDEKLAEVAFDLVPGQIEKVVRGDFTDVTVSSHPSLNFRWVAPEDVDPLYVDPPVFHRVALQQWVAHDTFAFDKKSGALFVYEKDPDGTKSKNFYYMYVEGGRLS